jgi:hypothetical protein
VRNLRDIYEKELLNQPIDEEKAREFYDFSLKLEWRD